MEANQAGKGEESAADTPHAALATTTTTTSSEVEAKLKKRCTALEAEVKVLKKSNDDYSTMNMKMLVEVNPSRGTPDMKQACVLLQEEVKALTKTNANFSKSNVALLLSVTAHQAENQKLLQAAETHATAKEQLQHIKADLEVTQQHASVPQSDNVVLYAAELSCICCIHLFLSSAADTYFFICCVYHLQSAADNLLLANLQQT